MILNPEEKWLLQDVSSAAEALVAEIATVAEKDELSNDAREHLKLAMISVDRIAADRVPLGVLLERFREWFLKEMNG